MNDDHSHPASGLPWTLAGPGMIIGDGAMGTMLQARGLALGAAPERWNLERPEDVIAVHREYAEAGARWIQTNTFGGTRARLAHCGLEAEVQAVNREAVRCARAAAGIPVIASVGPSGGEVSEWERLYAEQCEALADEGIDGYTVETIVSLAEGVAAVRAAARTGTGVVIATVTPSTSLDLLDGTPLEEAAEELVASGANIVGVNCETGPEPMLPAVSRLVSAGIAPVIARPNAGLPELVAGKPRYALSTAEFARAAIDFQKAGARFFGGCCGTSPEHIRAAVAVTRGAATFA